MTRTLLSQIALFVFSPTRVIIDVWKRSGSTAQKGERLRRWSFNLFALEVVACVLLLFAKSDTPSRELSILACISLAYAWSRVNEIVYAFYSDALEPRKSTDLTRQERIRMAMRSYYGLAFNFALAYYFIPVSGMLSGQHPGSFWEAFYFSGITLSTLGYSDIFPVHMWARGLALYEVFAGILIVAVAIATYAGGSDG